MSTLRILFSFKGRIGRRQFLLGTIIPSCIIITLLNSINGTQEYIYIIHSIGYLTIAWLGTAGYAKRLHDINQSGWALLLFYVPASITYALSLLNFNQQWVLASGYFTFLVGLWFSIKAIIAKGNLGENKFVREANPYSNKYFIWISKLKDQLKVYKNERWQENKIKKDVQIPSNAILEPNNEKGVRSDLLDNWFSKDNQDTSSFNEHSSHLDSNKSDNFINDSNLTEPEILRATHSVFGKPGLNGMDEGVNQEKPRDGQSTPTDSTSPSVNNKVNNGVDTIQANSNKIRKKGSIVQGKTEIETERFLDIMKKRATDSPIYQLYLQNSAESGNSWAKLEIAATWLSNVNTGKEKAEKAIQYLGELANSSQSHLGAETEAAYFLGEIYRVGLRYSRPNEDLSFKYLIRAAALGHKFAQQNIASQIALNSENENPIIQSLIKKALDDAECATALMQLIELDWSITYIDSINLILRSLVDNGDQRAASFLGRILLERKDYKTSVHILNLADKLDDSTIDKIMNMVKGAESSENIINSFVDIIKKHANLDNSYANYQIAIAFRDGIGMPQDNMMAFVHATIASARVYGQDRDKLMNLRDQLRIVLTEEEISESQKIIRENYTNKI